MPNLPNLGQLPRTDRGGAGNLIERHGGGSRYEAVLSCVAVGARRVPETLGRAGGHVFFVHADLPGDQGQALGEFVQLRLRPGLTRAEQIEALPLVAGGPYARVRGRRRRGAR